MSQRLDVLQLEESYRRRVLFAIELLDAVTLTRVSQGVTVTADGLQGKPILNASGMFVWLEENNSSPQRISIDPGALPYESRDLQPADVKLPPAVTTVELQPRVGYDFAPGITGLRGTLIEERAEPAIPVGDAAVRLQWLDDENNWHIAPTISHTEKRGDFVSILRLAQEEVPDIDTNGAATVRLQVRRNGSTRSSTDLKLLQGRVTDPTTLNSLTFAWDELQP